MNKLFRFLNANGINVINPNQIYFKNNPNCAASRLDESYTLEILPPFDSCGTSLQVSHILSAFITNMNT